MEEDAPKHATKFNKVFQFWKKFDITLQAQVGNAEGGAPPTKRIFGRGRGITTNSEGTMILSSSPPPVVISPRGIQSFSPVSHENTSDSHEGKPEDAQTTILREPLRSLMRLASTRKAKEMYEQDLATKPTSETSTPETNGKLESESSTPPLESTSESPSTSTTIPSLEGVTTSKDARSGEESKETHVSEIVKEEEVATVKVEAERKDEIVEVIEEGKVEGIETEGLKEEVSEEGKTNIEETQEIVTAGNEIEVQSSVQEEREVGETLGRETHLEESDLKSAATPNKTKGSKKHKKKRKTKSTITNNSVVSVEEVATVPTTSTSTPTLAAEVSSASSASSPSQSHPLPPQSQQSTELQVSFSTKEHSTSELNGDTPKSLRATVSPPSPSPPPSLSLYVSNNKNKEEPPSPKKKKRGSGSFRVKLGLGSKVETKKAIEHFAPSSSATTANVQSSHSAPTLSSLAEPGVPPKQRKWAQARQGTLADEMVQMNESIEKKKKEVVHAPPKRLMEAVAGAGESLSSSDLREKVIQEIIDTEKEYVQDLEVIINVFLTPLRDQTILAAEDTEDMFINIERIHKIHRKFLATLEHQDSREYIGSVFLNTVRSFEPYNEYCAKYQEAVDKVAELRKNVDSFDTFLRYCRCRPECHQLELTAFLIKPLQRICKYPLLLREVLKYTTLDHSDHMSIFSALDAIQKTVGAINEVKRADEEQKEKERERDKELRKKATKGATLMKLFK